MVGGGMLGARRAHFYHYVVVKPRLPFPCPPWPPALCPPFFVVFFCSACAPFFVVCLSRKRSAIESAEGCWSTAQRTATGSHTNLNVFRCDTGPGACMGARLPDTKREQDRTSSNSSSSRRRSEQQAKSRLADCATTQTRKKRTKKTKQNKRNPRAKRAALSFVSLVLLFIPSFLSLCLTRKT